MSGKGSVYGDGIATLVQLTWFQQDRESTVDGLAA